MLSPLDPNIQPNRKACIYKRTDLQHKYAPHTAPPKNLGGILAVTGGTDREQLRTIETIRRDFPAPLTSGLGNQFSVLMRVSNHFSVQIITFSAEAPEKPNIYYCNYFS